jgi:translation initiation factor 2 subunit 1
MKSKTVASIMRHVASKIPASDASDPATPMEPKKPKRTRKEAQEDAINNGVVEDGGGIGGENEEEKLEMLYETIAWPLGNTYGHPYDAFKLALTCVSHFWSS